MNSTEEALGVPEDIQNYIYNLFLNFITSRQLKLSTNKKERVYDMIMNIRNGGEFYLPVFDDSSLIFGEYGGNRRATWISIIKGNYDLFYNTVNPPKEYNINGQKFIV